MKICLKCPYDCLTCNGSNCTNCSPADNRTLFNSRCVPQSGYYDDGRSQCNLCPSTCTLCSSLSYCTSCQPGYLLSPSHECISTCPVRFLSDNTLWKCLPCPYDCYTCDSVGTCLSCNITSDFRVIMSFTGRCLPLEGFYESSQTVALKCPTQCSRCISSQFCTACHS